MATDPQRMEWILEQMEGAGNLRYRKMFGEYGVYCDEVFFAVVCDGTLFIKPHPGGPGGLRAAGAAAALPRGKAQLPPG